MNWMKFELPMHYLRAILRTSRDNAPYQRLCRWTHTTKSTHDVDTDEPPNNTGESSAFPENMGPDIVVDPVTIAMLEMSNDANNYDSTCENQSVSDIPELPMAFTAHLQSPYLETTADEPVQPNPTLDASEELQPSYLETTAVQPIPILDANEELQPTFAESSSDAPVPLPIVATVTNTPVLTMIPVLSKRKTRADAKSSYVVSVEDPVPQKNRVSSKSSVATVLEALKLPNLHTYM